MLLHRLLIFTVIWAIPLALTACSDKSPIDPRTQIPLVRTAAVERVNPELVSFTGSVAARVQSDMGFRVSGKVLERFVNTGQTVRRGQLLMRLDPTDLRLAAQAQQDAVLAARSHAEQTAEDEVRYHNLMGTGATSPSIYSQMKAAADIAKSQLRAAEAQAQVARNANRYTQLVANADGVIIETLVEPGQVVGIGQVVLRIAHAGPREAVVQLPETLRPAMGSSGRAALFGKVGVTVPARLRQLSNAADPLTRTFEARYVLGEGLANAPIGSTVTIQIKNGSSNAETGLQVPIGALLDMGKGPGVWIIHGQPSRVSWRPVVVRRLEDDTAHIAGGLKQGDRIVALGAHLLREGDRVRVATETETVEGAHP